MEPFFTGILARCMTGLLMRPEPLQHLLWLGTRNALTWTKSSSTFVIRWLLCAGRYQVLNFLERKTRRSDPALPSLLLPLTSSPRRRHSDASIPASRHPIQHSQRLRDRNDSQVPGLRWSVIHTWEPLCPESACARSLY